MEYLIYPLLSEICLPVSVLPSISLTYINTWHTYICLFNAFKNKDKSTKNRHLMSQAMQTQHFTWNAAFIKRLLNRLIACKPKLCRVVSGYPWGSAVIKPALQAHEKYGNARRKVPLPYGQQHRPTKDRVIARKIEKAKREQEVYYRLLISPPFAVFSLSPTTKQAWYSA